MALVVNMSVRLICVDSSFTQITFSRLRYSFSFVSISHTFCATRPSWFHGKYSPSTKPPQALNVQSQARMSPLSLMTNVDPQSRIHESLLVFSTMRMFSGIWARVLGRLRAISPVVRPLRPKHPYLRLPLKFCRHPEAVLFRGHPLNSFCHDNWPPFLISCLARTERVGALVHARRKHFLCLTFFTRPLSIYVFFFFPSITANSSPMTLKMTPPIVIGKVADKVSASKLNGTAVKMMDTARMMTGAMTVPPMMIAFGICFFGSSMSPANVQMTSNPNILKMMTEMKERLSRSKAKGASPRSLHLPRPASVPCTHPGLRAPPPKTL